MRGCMSRETFLKEYELSLDDDFSRDGEPTAWATSDSKPRFWGQEDHKLEACEPDPSNRTLDSAALAVSPDEKIMAVATNAVIRIYDPESKEMLSELRGHTSHIGKLVFLPSVPLRTQDEEEAQDGGARPATKYILFSENSHSGRNEDVIFVWLLDDRGRQIGRRDPMDVTYLASRALDAVSPDLCSQHHLDELAVESIRSAFAKALQEADARNRVVNVQVFNGRFPSYNSLPASKGGDKLLYIAHPASTQGAMRPAEELPQVVLYSMHSRTEVARLKGHTDFIPWAAISPADDNIVATASWDQTFRIWDVRMGVSKAVIETTYQNWAGAFSPDGSKVLFNGGGGESLHVRIYDVETAQELVRLPELPAMDLLRNFAWSGAEIALLDRGVAMLWKPCPDSSDVAKQSFEDNGAPTVGHGALTRLLRLHEGEDSLVECFANLKNVSWIKDGSSRKLVVQTSESTTFVWDWDANHAFCLLEVAQREIGVWNSVNNGSALRTRVLKLQFELFVSGLGALFIVFRSISIATVIIGFVTVVLPMAMQIKAVEKNNLTLVTIALAWVALFFIPDALEVIHRTGLLFASRKASCGKTGAELCPHPVWDSPIAWAFGLYYSLLQPYYAWMLWSFRNELAADWKRFCELQRAAEIQAQVQAAVASALAERDASKASGKTEI
ncbi:WD40-repeat-containing domain protein [Geranomyces variabilis]|nr:WD40-repeat-containing domain protein [Geranomyces variabilis]KAJ3134272.1 hypothetical protein HDU90_005138 [Geranomyces variabilis]